MKKLGNAKFSNKDYKYIIERYIAFYAEESECSEKCPVGLSIPALHHAYGSKIYKEFGRLHEKLEDRDDCFCHGFPEFVGLKKDACPCTQFGEDAFVRLEKLVERLLIK